MFAISMAVQPGRRHGVDIGAIVKKALRKALDDDVTRRDAADDRERRKLSAVLGRPESELFEEAVA